MAVRLSMTQTGQVMSVAGNSGGALQSLETLSEQAAAAADAAPPPPQLLKLHTLDQSEVVCSCTTSKAFFALAVLVLLGSLEDMCGVSSCRRRLFFFCCCCFYWLSFHMPPLP
jgi:hypothetical protein